MKKRIQRKVILLMILILIPLNYSKLSANETKPFSVEISKLTKKDDNRLCILISIRNHSINGYFINSMELVPKNDRLLAPVHINDANGNEIPYIGKVDDDNKRFSELHEYIFIEGGMSANQGFCLNRYYDLTLKDKKIRKLWYESTIIGHSFINGYLEKTVEPYDLVSNFIMFNQ